MRQMFVNKVKETEAELKEKEREVSVEPELRLQVQGSAAVTDGIPYCFLCFFFSSSPSFCSTYSSSYSTSFPFFFTAPRQV